MNGKSPIPGLTPEEYAEWRAAYLEELAADSSDEGQVLRRAAERTAHLWGTRVAPDGTVVINPDRRQRPESQHEPRSSPEPDQEPEAGL